MNYKVFSSFILRSPLLPYTDLEEIWKDKSSFLNKLSNETIQEAIFLASPVVYEELIKLLEGSIVSGSEEEMRLLSSLGRYMSRMSTRCTPFGLFAGCKVGRIDKVTNLNVKKASKRKTRLDMLYLYNLYDTLTKGQIIKENMKYYPNSSIYPFNGKYRYIESKNVGYRRKYQIVEVEQSPYLKKILDAASKGVNKKDLSTILINDEILEEEAVEFIDELIDSQLLVGELSQSIIGEDFFTRMLRLLNLLNPQYEYLNKLRKVESYLNKLDSDESKMELYDSIKNELKNLGVYFQERFLFQVDMAEYIADLCIGAEIIEEVKSSISFLNRITPSYKNNELEQFKRVFHSRYENREIPLMEALDPDIGLSYPPGSSEGDISPLLEGFHFPNNPTLQQNMYYQSPLESILFNKVIECCSKGKEEIILTDDDIKHLPINWDDLPPTMFAIVNIIKSGPNNPLIKLNSVSGSCAANLMARFAHVEEKINDLVKEITQKEQEILKDIVLAEIIHLPESRTGNVLARPHIRDYEILYLSSSDIPEKRKIFLSDLFLSVQDDELIIRSSTLDKKIIPRLTTAHNYENSMPIYRFLCDMQIQSGRRSLFFNWGRLGRDLKYRPRVKYKNTILAPSSWKFQIKELEFMFEINDDDLLKQKIVEWRKDNKINRFLLLPDNDNELFIDFDNIFSIRSLIPIIKNRETVEFVEFLFDERQIYHNQSYKNAYTNECIIPLYKNKA